MANDKNLQGVYNTLKKEGYTPPEYEQFVKEMQDDNNLQGVYNTLKKEGYTPPEYEQFRTDMFGAAPAEAAPAAPQRKGAAEAASQGRNGAAAIDTAFAPEVASSAFVADRVPWERRRKGVSLPRVRSLPRVILSRMGARCTASRGMMSWGMPR